ncbi:YcaQ family DNA glycosylase [Alteromonas sp. 5E99-2]|uniref:winged helix-turn-helix domain-containing protein n=1 Tax=Alteromonas sp. 5E99-2 TaxID=2817683 RepID=UPI001A97FF63|nr:crosslink repair DNA glycosylase YcaQ family protein [Alteromonas sp. 5E99-2]MBO1255463.1 YcaQ family DNA glycosylase [Alteromonas sp. 5E99-2]
MINIKHPKDLLRLRRFVLEAQGLLQANAFGRGIAGACNAIEHLGYIQIDTISVVERAHNHVLFSRVPSFKPHMINQLLVAGEVFEYWSHAAAFLPIDDFRFSLPFKDAIKNGAHPWFKNKDKKLMSELLEKIRLEGPLRSRDLEKNTKKGREQEINKAKHTGWWDWKPAKKALDQLYMEGELMVSSREGFQKTYDITERVLPSHTDTSMPSTEEFAEHIINQQLRCHGLVSLKGFTYLRRSAELREEVKALVIEKVNSGLLEEVKVADSDVFFMEVGTLDRKLPRLNKKMHILSPFDNSVIQRERLKTLFQFDYQIECYLPEAKRKYGYFSLPLLYRAEFVGRMDCKAHRKNGHLEIKSLYFEIEHFEHDELISAFVMAINEFCQFQQCCTVSVVDVHPKGLLEDIRVRLQ